MCGILSIVWWNEAMGSTDNLHQFDRHMVWAGFIQLAPISLFVAVFGAAFGLALRLPG